MWRKPSWKAGTITLTGMCGCIPADADMLGQPAFGGGTAFWAAGPWMEPSLGSEDPVAEQCRVREHRGLSRMPHAGGSLVACG